MKCDAFTEGMKTGKAGTDRRTGSSYVMLSFLSTTGKLPVGHPFLYAKELNARLLNIPREELKGWIITDFITPQIAQYIYGEMGNGDSPSFPFFLF